MKNPKNLFILLIFLAAIAGCNNDNNGSLPSDGTGSEVATAAMGGVLATSEGSVAKAQTHTQRSRALVALENLLSPIPSTWAVPGCDWSNSLTSCNPNNETLTFDRCSSPSDRAIAISGSETLYWTGSGCCTSNPLTASSKTPCYYTRRTVDKNGERDPLIRAIGENSISLDTELSSGYSSQKSGGFVVICEGSGSNQTCDGQRRIQILGAHYTGKSGRAMWDHTVSTDEPFVAQGHGSSRKVLSGTLRVQHNLLNMDSVTTINSTLTYNDSCCFPVGGTITTTFIGGTLDGKSETFTYGPNCGDAIFENSEHQISGFTLHHCL